MNSGKPEIAVAFLFIAVLVSIGSIGIFIRYCCLPRSSASLAWFVTLISSVAFGVYRFQELKVPFHSTNSRQVSAAIFSSLLVLFAAAFFIRLYRKWLDDQLTPEERAAGAVGIRAWLSPANLAVLALISLFAWQAFGWSPLLTIVLGLALLLAWPLLHHGTPAVRPAQVASAPAGPEPSAREREKILALLESGKISADESAELLHALAASSGPVSPMSPTRSSLGLIGAALVLVGFFLPWFSFSPGAKLESMMGQMHPQIEAPMLEMTKSISMPTVRIRGGDIGNGLGWIVLVLALAAALLPDIARSVDRASLRIFRVLSLLGGGIILLYLLSQDPSSVSLGLVLAIVGYIASAVALWREGDSALRSARPAEIKV